MRYRVAVEAAGKRAEGEPGVFEAPAPSMLKFEPLSDRGVRLFWSASQFPSNFTHYILYRDNGNFSQEVAWIRNVEDTTFSTTFGPFGAVERYYTRTGPGIGGEVEGTSIGVWLDERVPGIGLPQRLGTGYVARTDSHLVLLHADSKAILAQYRPDPYTFSGYAASPDGTRLFSIQGGKAVEHDLQTLAPVRQQDLRSLIGYDFYPEHLRVASNGRLFFNIYEQQGSTSFDRGAVIVDTEPLRLVARFEPYPFRISAASSDGRYFVLNSGEQGGVLYEIIEGRPEVVGSLPVRECPAHSLHFLQDGAALAEQCDQEVTVRRTTDLEVVRTFGLISSLWGVSYDPATGYLGGSVLGAAQYVIYDPATGTQLAAIDVDGSGSPYALVGGTLWSSGISGGFYRLLYSN